MLLAPDFNVPLLSFITFSIFLLISIFQSTFLVTLAMKTMPQKMCYSSIILIKAMCYEELFTIVLCMIMT